MKKKTVAIILGLIFAVILIALIVIDFICFYCKDIDSIILRVLEIIFASSSSFSLSVSFSIKNEYGNIQSKSNTYTNTVVTNVNIVGDSNDNQLVLPATDTLDIKNDLTQVKEDLELLKKENIEKICSYVIEQINNSNNLRPIDLDFILKYLTEGSSISDTDIQKIWASLLVAKVTGDVSVTKRLLDIVKNLSTEEASLFNKVAEVCTDDGTIFDLFAERFSFDELSLLIEIGLIKPHDMLSQECHFDQNIAKTALAKNSSLVIVCNSIDNKNHDISYSCKALTNEGLLLKRALKIEIDDNNLFELAKYLIKETKDKGIKITLHKITSISEKGIEYCDDNLLDDE